MLVVFIGSGTSLGINSSYLSENMGNVFNLFGDGGLRVATGYAQSTRNVDFLSTFVNLTNGDGGLTVEFGTVDDKKSSNPGEGVRFPPVALSEYTIIIPKNSGLKAYAEKAKEVLGIAKGDDVKLLEMRGEDIPFMVNQLVSKGKKVLGCVGEDLFKEWSLENKGNTLEMKKRIVWDDPNTLFGKPALCLMGDEDTKLEDYPKELTVCINAKYKALSKKYLNMLEGRGYRFNRVYMKGCVEESISLGVADLIVEIVYSGRSMKEYCLQVYDKLFQSDFLIIGEKDTVVSGGGDDGN